MSKIAIVVAGIMLLASGFLAGKSLSPAPAHAPARAPEPLPVPGSPPPRSAGQATLDIERLGQIQGTLLEPNPFSRVEALASLLNTLDADDVPSVAAALERDVFGIGNAEADLLARFWAYHDPDPAVEWAWMSSPYGVRGAAIDGVMETVAGYDPARAVHRMEELGGRSETDTNVGREALIRGWVFSGRPGLDDYLISLDHGAGEQKAIRAAARALFLRDGAEGLVDWLNGIPEDEGYRYKTSAYRWAAPELMRADRESAMKWCDEHCYGPHGDHVLAILAKTWATQEGEAALTWVSRAEPGEQRDRAVKAAFMSWRWSDPESLEIYLSEMGPEGVEPWFLPAVDRVAMWKSWDYPLEALEWAALIPGEEARELACITITRRFREADEESAEAWLEQSWLSEEARAKAREYPTNWKGRGNRPYPPAPKNS